ncbi:MAG: hypothetical protein QM541_16655, partial [Flavobacterium sp.]|nr:hypothetical protein [Flavobacterium sp.]
RVCVQHQLCHHRCFTNTTIQAPLQLPFFEKRKSILADGSIKEYEIVGPIHLKFSNRTATCSAVVLPGIVSHYLAQYQWEKWMC